MKKLLTLTLALIALAALSGFSAAPPKGEQKSQPEGVEMKQAATGDKKTVDTVLSKPVTGEVTGSVTALDPTAKTVTLMVQGRAITFSTGRLSKLPPVGKNINLTFILAPAGLPMATSTTEAGSTARPHLGGNKHCGHPLVGHHDPLNSLNVCNY
jgi:hypothetical protein